MRDAPRWGWRGSQLVGVGWHQLEAVQRGASGQRGCMGGGTRGNLAVRQHPQLQESRASGPVALALVSPGRSATRWALLLSNSSMVTERRSEFRRAVPWSPAGRRLGPESPQSQLPWSPDPGLGQTDRERTLTPPLPPGCLLRRQDPITGSQIQPDTAPGGCRPRFPQGRHPCWSIWGGVPYIWG